MRQTKAMIYLIKILVRVTKPVWSDPIFGHFMFSSQGHFHIWKNFISFPPIHAFNAYRFWSFYHYSLTINHVPLTTKLNRTTKTWPMTTHTAASTITPMSGGLLSTIYGTIEAVVKYRQYCKTITELSSLSTKELSDIGLSLSAIKSVARETIYRTVIT